MYVPHVAAGAALTWTLNNHDVQRAVTRYGRADATSPDSWTGNNLVYTDTPVDLDLGTRRARAMCTFVAALPGALYLYQGEELGLPEVLDLPLDRRQDPIVVRTEGRVLGRDGCRVPLPWTGDPTTSFGFSATAAARSAQHEPWLPQPDGWGAYAFDAQQSDASSMLSLYRARVAPSAHARPDHVRCSGRSRLTTAWLRSTAATCWWCSTCRAILSISRPRWCRVPTSRCHRCSVTTIRPWCPVIHASGSWARRGVD